ncbi:MAG: hypothetical protein B6245_03590 [Desulfobacteraceae bacterium 4572_88]|nr:MAG: hypothetical protein B6245_03590 [Desulfobacteraceae bacterium 4572_88]
MEIQRILWPAPQSASLLGALCAASKRCGRGCKPRPAAKIGPGAIKAVPSLVKSLADGNKTVRSTVKVSMDKIVLK